MVKEIFFSFFCHCLFRQTISLNVKCVFCSVFSRELNVLDLVECSKEQMEFLDKFFKDNPWADNAQIDAIVKQTGLNERIIKVKKLFSLL